MITAEHDGKTYRLVFSHQEFTLGEINEKFGIFLEKGNPKKPLKITLANPENGHLPPKVVFNLPHQYDGRTITLERVNDTLEYHLMSSIANRKTMATFARVQEQTGEKEWKDVAGDLACLSIDDSFQYEIGRIQALTYCFYQIKDRTLRTLLWAAYHNRKNKGK